MSYVSKEQIERVKQMDLLTYLQCFEPYELVRCSRNAFSTRTHGSLKISNGKWFWWSRGIGGRSALDYLIKVRGLSFPDAVMQIDGNSPVPLSSAAIAQQDFPHTGLELPEPYENSNRVIAYLRKRGISRDVVDFCLNSGRLYESRMYHNAIFVGFDMEGTPRYAAIRGTTKTRYMGEASGSDKRYSFAIPADDSPELHLFESAIDLLSYCTLAAISGKEWRQSHHLSLAGIYTPKEKKDDSIAPAALTHYLQSYPEVKRLVLHLDNDAPGRAATRMIQQLLGQTYFIPDEPPISKDVNDDLKDYRKQREEQTR
ncbi:topoisomerase [Paenibacillus odorifer]|uniref:DUF3991 and TOPRIM domain-containing protein n=1 Tax=Paenibacillus TaxID=44249 RepID=UPI0003E1C3A9|nr:MULTISPECIES: DUF3991 and TOPRIM domain-containing protein [Paenibacillus]ETT54677.1 LtrC [Paenibacillus sp. FSL H8-237]OME50706.1 topoisomerase [Paenibacillus odorifer]SIR50128.1 Protein of unknown function [Paenibacillus sp. RU4X]SIR59164.1 Protein of unknown function [Paenibacillus sp. RU4T]